MRTLKDYRVVCVPLQECADLASMWLDLESRADNEVFLSWAWISTWLMTYRPRVDVLQVWCGDLLVALVLLARADTKRFHIINSQIIYFNQTGNPREDQIWIEYNGLLADNEHRETAIEAACHFLIHHYSGWDELIVGAVKATDAALLHEKTGLDRHDLWQAPTYGVDLSHLRVAHKSYLSTLSRNTRYQITRALKKYGEAGQINVTSAGSMKEALDFFMAISPLHIARWGGEADQSGFANPLFVEFHRNLISQHWDNGLVDVNRILVGDQVIAHFYNFVYRGRIYFYLSGLAFEEDPALKPGMVGHALCIERYLQKGMNYYDFMGGGERYKASLATEHSPLFKIALQKRRLKFGLEKAGRRVKHKLLGVTGQITK